MSNTDPLAKYFKADAAPATDITFRLSVMEQVARKRFALEMAKNMGTTILLALAVALSLPALKTSFAGASTATMTTLTTLVAVGLVAYAGQWLMTHRWSVRRLIPR